MFECYKLCFDEVIGILLVFEIEDFVIVWDVVVVV